MEKTNTHVMVVVAPLNSITQEKATNYLLANKPLLNSDFFDNSDLLILK